MVLSNNNSLDIRDSAALESATEKMNMVITKNYLAELSDYDVLQIDDEILQKDIIKSMRLYKLDKFVYQKDESVIDKLGTALNVAFTNGMTVITIMDSNGEKTDFYIGAVNRSEEDGSVAGETLEGAFNGNFPGSYLSNIDAENIERIIKNSITGDTSGKVVSSVSAIPSLRKKNRDEIKAYTQGVENMIDALSGKKYTAIMIADPIQPDELDRIELGYEMLYTQLSPYAKSAYSYNESKTTGTSHSDTTSITKSINQSVSYSNSTSVNSGWSTSKSDTKSTSADALKVLGAAIGMIPNPITNIVGGIISIAGSMGFSKSHTTSESESGGTSEQHGTTDTKGTNLGSSKSATDTNMNSDQSGRSLTITSINKTVQDLLGKIDEHLARIKSCRVYGAFNSSTYVISDDTQTNGIVSANYKALIHGESSSMQASYVNTWDERGKPAEVKELKKYLSKFTHPIFLKPNNTDLYLSACSVVTGQELAVQTALPKKSVNGISVVETAPFGRNIYRLSDAAHKRSANMGRIYHMGKVSGDRVKLDLDSLASHTFVTGSTGSGKSNTVYKILNEAVERSDVKFLVVEPAKGEYKDVFGGREDVCVYGTNPNISRLLRINPFSFAKGIHILEHLDRLIEIFSVCWPMYAAMPAVLKKAVERAYEVCGWDLMTSENKIDNTLYPTFKDVLNEIYNVVNESSYSSDSKSDYIGSLATRVESLTNGFYKMIFTNNSVSDVELFNKNVIIDLSRIGSQETKSFIMGLMVMKLQEYHMSCGTEGNSELKHITVLEEAHNLLKRTSTEQSSEGSNILGKSVEMIANAIAEMRTYGEGFIIADQSPGLMDMSVIRNTNTKIILRLPDYGDRTLVGKAIGLNEQQIVELSKLPKGVAAVYQNDWIEAVLCQVDKCEENKPFEKCGEEELYKDDKDVEAELLDLIMTNEIFDGDLAELRKIRESVMNSNIPGVVKYNFSAYLKNHRKNRRKYLLNLLSVFFAARRAIDIAEDSCEDIDSWRKSILSNLAYDISGYTELQKNKLIGLLLYPLRDSEYDKIFIYISDLCREAPIEDTKGVVK